jgi:hypothetical protein
VLLGERSAGKSKNEHPEYFTDGFAEKFPLGHDDSFM